MAKKAFCVGINDYPTPGADLRGCVNDAHAWADLLTAHFDFPTSDVRILTDGEATKAGMLAGLKHLLAGAGKGDVLVFTNSSHGSYIVDTGGDEDRYDQVVCPYDLVDNLIVDDELREVFSAVPNGVSVVAIMDNCHSGNGTRRPRGAPPPPETRRARFVDPALRGAPTLKDPLRARPRQPEKYPESGMKEVLLSGCTALESSFDDKIDGVFHGAMTWYALKAIRDAKHALTYAELHDRLGTLLKDTPYQQHPQLEGRSTNKARQIFT
jgi:hypothetical protein